MTVFIFGGSNSLRRTGWTAQLTELAPDTEIVNRSIGAATSLMAIFRLLTDTETGPKPGDIVVWEYALNEAIHITRGYDTEIALKNLERFIQECARRQLRLAAAIFTPRSQEKAKSRLAYYDELDKLLAHYNVKSFDVSKAWRSEKSVRNMPLALYMDDAHYGADPELNRYIAQGILSAVASAVVPENTNPLRVASKRLGVQLFEEGERFKNAHVSLPVAPHRSVMRLDCDARAIGVAALVHPYANSALRLELTREGHFGSWLNLTTAGIEIADKIILKVFSLEAALGTPWHLQPGDRLAIYPLRRTSKVYGESHSRTMLKTLDKDQHPAFIGLVLDLPA